MTNPAAVNDAATSVRYRNLNVEAEVRTAPSAPNTKLVRNDTSGNVTSVRSIRSPRWPKSLRSLTSSSRAGGRSS
jgi:hypothetical protein